MSPQQVYFLETSVLLRFLFAEPNSLNDLTQKPYFVASELIRLEALRTIDRMRLTQGLQSHDVANRMRGVNEFLRYVETIPVQSSVIERASLPFPTPIRSLDALHLSSALLWKQSKKKELVFLTHDIELAQAAQALGLEVEGC